MPIHPPLHRALLTLLLAGLFAPVQARSECEQKAARLVSLQGVLEVQADGPDEWKPVTPEQAFCPGEKIRTRLESRATLELNNKTYITLNQQTTVVFSGLKPKSPSWLDLLKGIIYVRSRTPSSLDVRTPYVNAAIRGTEFLVSAGEDQAEVSVLEGAVESFNDKGRVNLADGQSAIAKAGEAPVMKLLIKPRDAVQWALYYPPVIDLQRLEAQASDPAVKLAARRYQEGDSLGALAALDGAQAAHTLYRAALLIGLGRVEEAKPLLDEIDPTDANSAAEALALRAVVALADNDKTKSVDLAQKATRRQPQSPVAWTALSYARQGNFELEAALQAARKAAALDPGNALARAREAELLAALGRRSEARASAAEAAQLNPGLSRAWAVQGFAQLNQMDYRAATESFLKAIALDSADPLPRFGLGLAKIRAGKLEEGTADLEIAANLDPNDALLRSYLGKAYYEKKNSKVAAAEFDIAKQLDPEDPTPWFYDAIKKQTENREVEAVRDMRHAIELNGNRGVYRSKQLLDDDLAARGSALGRIYNQVGLQRLGQLEAFDSLEINPSNYTAHRLLSDTWLNVPRHESARVSELLQAQMLQPVNITPLQPQQAENNLLTVSGLGPANPSMNEFNPLFARNQISFLPSALAGSFDTYGNETVVSGIYDRFSASFGQMHMSTQGFRKNNDIDENLYTAFLQGQVSETFNVQAEYRHRDIDNGFLPLHFAPTPLQILEQNTYRRNETSDIYRFGAHWSPTLSSDLLSSFAYQDDQENVGTSLPGMQLGILFPRRVYSGEMQYLYRDRWFDAVTGGGHVETNGFQDTSINGMLLQSLNQDRIQTNGYVYLHPHYPDHFNWTLGLSGDSLKVDALNFDVTEINPKFGLTLQIFPATSLRLAYFRTLRHSNIGEQTLEPVQVAGFNQFYDDRVATTATRYGVAVDHHLDRDWSTGFELSQRNLNVPSLLQGAINATPAYEWKEQLIRAYLYWTPTDRISARMDYNFEDFTDSDYIINLNPPSTRTHMLPVAVSYFDPSGWFATAKATYVNQQVNTDGLAYQGDSFTLVDMNLGYRLPQRWGIIQLDIRNLLDQKFRYQSYDLRTQAVEQAPFFPDRAFYGRVTLSF